MLTEEIGFYLRHRVQISEWAALHERVEKLMRDAVTAGSHDAALRLLNGESGDDEVDFYVRNRALITEWDALQTSAGLALHDALLDAVRNADCRVVEGKRGWTTAMVRTPGLAALRGEHEAWIEMAWTKQDLLSTRRGFASPRIAIVLKPSRWAGEDRTRVLAATSVVAREQGLTKRQDGWWIHWGVLAEVAESQDLGSYADDCVEQLQEASNRVYPRLLDAILATLGPVVVDELMSPG